MPEFDFGHFHILGELGRGGMALVYEAIDTRTDETVALKILYPHLMSDENTIKRFQREARVATRLKHRYIVPVTDFGEHDNQIYIAMRYMSGNSLAELFVEPRAISIKRIIRILGEVASALDYAHQEGVIHRDLKLQNILLDDKLHAYLADFGIARLVDGTRLTATGQIAGTPMYMSPEQIRGKPIDFRSDIYSFSVMSYLLLTGYYPFTGEDSLAIIHKHVKEFPPAPTEVNSDLPKGVDGVLLRGLMKDPGDRYDSTLDMVKALHKVVNVPELHKTTTRIDIHAINPVDSIEMDAMPDTTTDSRVITSPKTTGENIPTDQDLRASMLQSGTITAQQATQGNTNRMGIFGIAFGIMSIAAIAIAVAFIAISEYNEHNFEVAESKRAITFNTQTDICEDALEQYDADGVLREREVLKTFDCTGTVQAQDGTPLQDKPGPEELGGQVIATLSTGTKIYIIGRDDFGGFVQIVTKDNQVGWLRATGITTRAIINDLPKTTPLQTENTPSEGGNNLPPPPEGESRPNRPGRNNGD